MKLVWIALLYLAAVEPLSASPQAQVEHCGWLVKSGDVLVQQPDNLLQPSDPKPLPAAPPQAKAAYCDRDTLMTYAGDERVIALGLPLVIRSGDREGALEATPNVIFDYHPVGDEYLPGKSDQK